MRQSDKSQAIGEFFAHREEDHFMYFHSTYGVKGTQLLYADCELRSSNCNRESSNQMR